MTPILVGIFLGFPIRIGVFDDNAKIYMHIYQKVKNPVYSGGSKPRNNRLITIHLCELIDAL